MLRIWREECRYFFYHLPHVIKVREDKSLVDVKATCDDVLGVLHGKAMALLHAQVLPKVLLVIRELDDQRDVKHVLQPPDRQDTLGTGSLGFDFNKAWVVEDLLGKDKRDEVSNVHGL